VAAAFFFAWRAEAQDEREQRLAEWVKQLDADEFLTRETATAHLLRAGPAALPALKSVLQSGSLEATSRAFYVVRELGLIASLSDGEEAWNLLKELSGRKEVPSIARRAAATLADLTQRRSNQAVSELEHLGAAIQRSEEVNGIPLDNPITYLEIGPAFRGTVADLSRLKWVADMPQVIFTGQEANDAWIKQIASMAALTELHLYRTQVTAVGLAALADHPALAQLGIYYTPIGDEALAPLAKLPALRFVKLYGTKTTIERVTDFKAAAGVAVDFRRGAFLGVGCSVLSGNCRVTSVHKDSPADKAGLLEEDVIVRYGQSPITTFDTLTNLIRQNAEGDDVEIEVTRTNFDKDGIPSKQNVVTKVRFTPWEMKPAVQQPPPR
jgi:hypothetical protein